MKKQELLEPGSVEGLFVLRESSSSPLSPSGVQVLHIAAHWGCVVVSWWGHICQADVPKIWKVSGRIFDLIIKETIMCEVTAVTAAVMEDTCFQKSALTDRPPSISPPMKIHVLISSTIFIFCCSSLFCLYPLVRLSFLFQFDEHQPEKRAMINPEGGEIERGREWSVNGDRDVGTEALIQHF